MIRELRLWYQTLCAYGDALIARWNQMFCEHNYRPARIGCSPARVCHACGEVKRMTPEEFFAQFGERLWQKY